jgi:hypothetical protein
VKGVKGKRNLIPYSLSIGKSGRAIDGPGEQRPKSHNPSLICLKLLKAKNG